jgi:predicted SprT family Zn-dependent metalloprotease
MDNSTQECKMQTPQQQVIDRCKEAFAKAKELYNLDLSMVGIRFDLKGRAAGMACARGSMFTGRTFFMRFNRDMMTREAFDHVLNNTVPHEVAHIVCFMNPMLGSNHDAGWERVCLALGGTGARTHKEEVVFGKGKTYEYTTTTGEKVRLSEQKHRRVQGGQPLVYLKKAYGQVNQSCGYAIVGYQGRTLAQPVQAKPAAVEPVPYVAPNPAPVRPVFAPTATRVATALPVSTAAGQPKSAIARALILKGYQDNLKPEVIVGAIIAATGMAHAMAKNYFKNGSKQLNLPASFYS